MSNDKIPVLVADGHLAYVRALQEILEACNYEVLTAQHSQMALELASSEQPALILLGSEMPGMNGFEVCRRIRKFSRAPIIMLDSVVSAANVAKGLNAGADDYITKLVRVDELLIKMQAMCWCVELSRQAELADRVTN